MAPPRGNNHDNAGFTLFEALVALAVASTFLSAISLLVGTSLHGTRSAEERVRLLQTARAIFSEYSDRNQLKPGVYSGSTADWKWTLAVQPYLPDNPDGRWQPEELTLNLAPNSKWSKQKPEVTFHTIRLHSRVLE